MTKRIAYTTILLLFIASVFTGCAGSADSAKTDIYYLPSAVRFYVLFHSL